MKTELVALSLLVAFSLVLVNLMPVRIMEHDDGFLESSHWDQDGNYVMGWPVTYRHFRTEAIYNDRNPTIKIAESRISFSYLLLDAIVAFLFVASPLTCPKLQPRHIWTSLAVLLVLASACSFYLSQSIQDGHTMIQDPIIGRAFQPGAELCITAYVVLAASVWFPVTRCVYGAEQVITRRQTSSANSDGPTPDASQQHGLEPSGCQSVQSGPDAEQDAL